MIVLLFICISNGMQNKIDKLKWLGIIALVILGALKIQTEQ